MKTIKKEQNEPFETKSIRNRQAFLTITIFNNENIYI